MVENETIRNTIVLYDNSIETEKIVQLASEQTTCIIH